MDHTGAPGIGRQLGIGWRQSLNGQEKGIRKCLWSSPQVRLEIRRFSEDLMVGIPDISVLEAKLQSATLELSIVIVSWNTCELLGRCLASLESELRSMAAEVFVVDNNSADDSADMVAREFPWVKLIRNADNRGFARANNQAVTLSAGEKILLLNPDTEIKPGTIRSLMRFLDEHPDTGIVAPQLLNTDGSIQRSCRQFPTFSGMLYELLGLSHLFPSKPQFRQYKMLDFDHEHERQVDQPEGACLLVRRDVVDRVGILDEGYFMLFEEVDWCYRIKQAGWEIWFTPAAQIVHHYGQSIKQVKVRMILSSHKGMYRFWRKHYAGHLSWLAPVVYVALMLLAVLRIISYSCRKLWHSQSAGFRPPLPSERGQVSTQDACAPAEEDTRQLDRRSAGVPPADPQATENASSRSRAPLS